MASRAQAPATPASAPAVAPSRTGIPLRIFLTCWAVYALHFSPFVVRELYLTISLAEKHSVRVDEFADLHSDLFTIPGRGTFLGHNPGGAILAAVPYWLSLPVVNRVAPVRPPAPDTKISAIYKEERPNRLAFYRKVRERGLDIHLGVAAMITSVFFMAPLTAFGVVVLYWLLGHFGFGQKLAVPLAILFGLGTPMFFRAAILSINLIVALLTLFALYLLLWPSDTRPEREPVRYLIAGLLAGWGVVTDYTAVITVGMLGLFCLVIQWQKKPFWPALKSSLWFAAGAVGPVAFMLFWQWYCFGNPWLPAQFYGPQKFFSGYASERGFGWPLPAILWGLIFDPLYGLLVFAPIFALALYHPVLIRRKENRVPKQVALFCWALAAALWVFCSCIHYTLRHQWQDGVRYMVPAVPFLFLLVADVMARMPRVWAYALAAAAVFETWCLAMVREAPLVSISRVVLQGLEVPWLTALVKTAPQYLPALAQGASPLPFFVILVLFLWILWRTDKHPKES